VRRGLVVVVLTAGSMSRWGHGPVALADGQAVAESTYEKAKALADAGNYAAACPLFDASFRADPALGTLLNLADCNEHVGKTATAWAQFRDLVDRAKKRVAVETDPGARAKDDERIRYATAHAAALEPRLMHVKLVAPAQPIAGLVVKLDDTEATGLLGVDVPLDPGAHHVVATAAGHPPWQTDVTLKDEGKTVVVAVPQLDAAGATPPVVATQPTTAPAQPTETPPPAAGMSGLRKLSIALAVGGVAGLVLGTVEGASGESAESASDKLCPHVTPCTGAGLQDNVNARNDANVANIGFVVGGVLAAGAIVTWIVGAPKQTDRMTVAPVLGGGTAGVALSGRF
jgi:hypothetical protein